MVGRKFETTLLAAREGREREGEGRKERKKGGGGGGEAEGNRLSAAADAETSLISQREERGREGGREDGDR